MPKNDLTGDIAVIGGGPAGMMAAGTALSLGASVTIFDRSGKLGKKLAITGKGRCNVTNASSRDEFLENVPRNPRFLYAALAAFSPDDTVAFFENLGVPLKTERGKRVFPVSDRAFDIVDAMKKYVKGASVVFERVTRILKEETGFTVSTESGTYRFRRVILATGGRSYPLTGSDGSGYALAQSLGHTVTPTKPSLVPLVSKDPVCPACMGLALKNVAVRVTDGGKTVYTDFGEMLFTHFGLSGPLILSASAHLTASDFRDVSVSIDLKPALDRETLDKRLLSDFAERSNKDFKNALDALLPSALREPFVRRTGIPETKKINALTKEDRAKVLDLLKNFSVAVSGFRPIEEAIVTSGGVTVREVSSSTLGSKITKGLYFAGEMLDVDAYTGGFNLQIAFSTGYSAGKSAAESLWEES